MPAAVVDEVSHWNACEARGRAGAREFWTNHPRVAYHYHQSGLVDGLPWRKWVPTALGRPAAVALELGCGNGNLAVDLFRDGTAIAVEGVDLDESRFAESRTSAVAVACPARFFAADINTLELPPCRYDLIYAVHSFHHFSALERIMEQVRQALTPEGLFVLEEYVGPSVFQWTDLQLAITEDLLALLPLHLRTYANGIEKRRQERDTPRAVLGVCPSEALRSAEIVPLFRQYFRVVYNLPLGGTIQHILYAGIIHNFADNSEIIDRTIDGIHEIERLLIERGVLTSDFALLIGTR